MKVSKFAVNAEYFLIQASYWMSFNIIVAFAALHLQERGFSNGELGLILCIGNIIGLILSPLIASVVDRYEKVDNVHTFWAMLALQMILLIALSFISGRSISVWIIYTLLLTCIAVIGPMVTQLSFQLELLGHHINFGAARSGGSIACAILSTVMGVIIGHYGAEVTSIAGIFVTAFEASLLALVTIQLRKTGHFAAPSSDSIAADSKTLPEFFAANKRFCTLILGMSVLYMAFSTLTNYMVNVVYNVGGDAADLGRINGFSSFVELPALFLADRLLNRYRCSSLMRFSLTMMSVKLLAVALVPNMPLLYAAMLMHTLSFALLTPVSVRYVELSVSSADSAKGQSLAFTSITIGTVLSSLFIGPLFDKLSVTGTMFICVGISAVGLIIALPAVKQTQNPRILKES